MLTSAGFETTNLSFQNLLNKRFTGIIRRVNTPIDHAAGSSIAYGRRFTALDGSAGVYYGCRIAL